MIRWFEDGNRTTMPQAGLPAGLCDWGEAALHCEAAWKRTKGEGVKVAILDTGWPDHPDVAPNVILRGSMTSDTRMGCVPATDTAGRDRMGHGCIMASDHIYVSGAGLIPIEQFYDSVSAEAVLSNGAMIKPVGGVQTLSLDAQHNTVTSDIEYVHKLAYRGPIYKIHTCDGGLSLTPWHPMYIRTSRRGNVSTIVKIPASELKEGDRIVTPSPAETFREYQQAVYARYYKCKFCGVSVKSNKSLQCKYCHRCSWSTGLFYNTKTVTEDMAYLMGLIASDGHISKLDTSIQFTNKSTTLICEFKSLVGHLFGLNTYSPPGRAGGVRDIRFCSKDAKTFLMQCGIPEGRKSLTLQLPKVIEKSPKSVILAFFAGMIDGDGNVGSNFRIRIISASREFVEKAALLLKTIGIRASFSSPAPSEVSTFGSKNPIYVLRIGRCKELLQSLRFKRPSDEALEGLTFHERRSSVITNIEVIDFDGFMYDLTVKEHHNYVANGFITSNTHVAGIVAANGGEAGVMGVAPAASLLCAQVTPGSMEDLIAGIEWAVASGADILNMSLGGPTDHPEIHEAVKRAYAAGVILVAAAGNTYTPYVDTVAYPARYPEVIAVAALDQSLHKAVFSACGPELVNAVALPGVSVCSTWIGGDYALDSGTSMAAPMLSGTIALFLALKRPTRAKAQEEVRKMLTRISKRCDDFCYTGLGMPDLEKL